MSSATSVGAIKLDLEVEAKLEGGVEKEVAQLANMIKKKLGAMKENMFDSLSKSVENAMSAMVESVKSNTDKSKQIMQKYINDMIAISKKLKIASPNLSPSETNLSNDVGTDVKSNKTPRGPPSLNIKKPKLDFDIEFNQELIRQRYDELEAMLDEYDNQILTKQKQRKKVLSSFSFNMDSSAETKLNEQVAKLDMQIRKLQDAAERTNITLKAMDRTIAQNAVNMSQSSKSTGNLNNSLKQTTSSASKIGATVKSSFRAITPQVDALMNGIVKLGKVFRMLVMENITVGETTTIVKRKFTESMLAMALISQVAIVKIKTSINSLKTSLNTLSSTMNNALKHPIKTIGNLFNSTFKRIGSISKSTILGIGNTFKSGLQKVPALVKRIGNSFRSLPSMISKATKALGFLSGGFLLTKRNADKASQSNKSYGSSVGSMIKSFTIFSLIFPLVSRGIMALMTSLGQSLMTNQQFASSLTQIKSNLMAAFMPIYNAILPALNALMSALATVTAYIASFVSSLFGTTYDSSIKAASGLVAAKDAMGAYGSAVQDAAKKAKDAVSATLGIDELNIIQPQTDSDSSSSGGSGNAPSIVPTAGDFTGANAAAEKFKAILSKIFEPFKQAWNAEGLNTINSFKHALNGILSLLGAIGNSMLTVWTNGTGTTVLTLILQIWQDIFNLIGRVSSDFANAWNAGGIGTQVIQNIYDAIINVLSVIHGIGTSLNNVWGIIGPAVANSFMIVLQALTALWATLTQAILDVWNNGGQHLFESLLILGAKLLEVAAILYANLVVPFVKWFIELLSPAIAVVLDSIGGLIDILVGLVDIFLVNLVPTIDQVKLYFNDLNDNVIKPLMNELSIGFKAAVQLVISILTSLWKQVIVPLSKELITTFKQSIKATMDMLKQLWSNFVVPTISVLKQLWQQVIVPLAKVLTSAFVSALMLAIRTIKDLWINAVVPLINILSKLWKTIVVPLAKILTDVLGIAIKLLSGIIQAIWKNVLAPLVIFLKDILIKVIKSVNEIWKAWGPTINSLMKILLQAWNNVLKPIANFVVGAFVGAFNGALTGIKSVIEGIKTIFSGLIDFITGVFTGNWSKAFNGLSQIIQGAFGGVVGIVKAPLNGIIGLVNSAIGAVNNISVDIPDWVPLVGGKHFGFSIPKIPMLAKGGIISQPTIAMVGEAGTEAVMPLENNTGWIDVLAGKLAERLDMNGGNTTDYEIVYLLQQIVEILSSLELVAEFDINGLVKLIDNKKKRLGKEIMR